MPVSLKTGAKTGKLPVACWSSIALMLPSMALFLGEWSASNRPFEILLLILCMLALNVPSLFLAGGFSTVSCVRMAVAVLLVAGMLFVSFCKRFARKKHTGSQRAGA